MNKNEVVNMVRGYEELNQEKKENIKNRLVQEEGEKALKFFEKLEKLLKEYDSEEVAEKIIDGTIMEQ